MKKGRLSLFANITSEWAVNKGKRKINKNKFGSLKKTALYLCRIRNNEQQLYIYANRFKQPNDVLYDVCVIMESLL